MYKLILFACLAHVALCEFNVKFNQLLDGQMDMVNQALAQAKIHNIPLPDQTVHGAVIKGAILGDIATLQRIGDATMTATDDSTLQVTSTIGLKSMNYLVSSYTSPKFTYENATFVIKSNAISWMYTIAFTSTGGCSMTVNDLEVSQLGDVTMYSPDPKMNDIDVSQQFEHVRQVINSYFKTPDFQTILEQHDPCKSASLFSKFLSVVV